MRDEANVAILESLREKQSEMIDLLTRVVEAESPSSDRGSQEAAYRLLSDAFVDLGFHVKRLHGMAVGDHIYARPQRRRWGRARQLIVGHLDTVWPVGTLSTMPIHRRNGRIFGPGICDMKGGLVQLVFALRALAEHGIEPQIEPLVFINSDEEIGSPESTHYISLLSRVVARAFILEPAQGSAGRLKTARKGAGRFTVTVHGVAAHAGSEPLSGASAILELSHQVQELFALNNPDAGITVNVGTIEGGMRSNVVAPKAVAHVGVRVVSDDQAEQVEHAIRSLAPVTDRTSVQVEGGFGRRPMERSSANQALAEAAIRLGESIGLELSEAGMVGGASDGNTTSPYTATLDGLGPVGQGAHAVDEHVVASSLPERAALLALLLASPQHG